jgi:hypothetical protein
MERDAQELQALSNKFITDLPAHEFPIAPFIGALLSSDVSQQAVVRLIGRLLRRWRDQNPDARDSYGETGAALREACLVRLLTTPVLVLTETRHAPADVRLACESAGRDCRLLQWAAGRWRSL